MKLLITASTFPVNSADSVPDFVSKQAIYFKQLFPELSILIHAPHSYHADSIKTYEDKPCEPYEQIRYHYIWPHRLELLTSKGIMPSLKKHPALWLEVPLFVVFQFFSLYAAVRKHRPDLIYAHWFTPQAISAALVSRLLKVPFVFTTHASDVSVLRRVPFSRQLVRYVCAHATAFTAVSKRTASKLQNFFDTDDWNARFSEKLSIIPMGVSFDQPAATLPSQSVNSGILELIGTPAVAFTILFIGRLAEKKGVSRLLDALVAINGSNSQRWKLLIAGDGPERSRLERQVIHNCLQDRVQFLGYVNGAEKQALFEKVDAVCLPSIRASYGDEEGFPVAMMEALYKGKIIIASDCSGAEEIIVDAENGFLFDSNSTTQLSDRITTVMNLSTDKKQQISGKAHSLGQRYHWINIARLHTRALFQQPNDEDE